ncbi:hypothetical protein BDN70DRAFT_816091 [Pholiota conissans]|uniref:SH3 domain-containing protein n=1 Tax=Pholiota conissans TaxID=109636 RepID=A0A9P6CW47_9AGAR|nr:hypothetical protein BDN70DRAFT_816091 [Pholiota conissans]
MSVRPFSPSESFAFPKPPDPVDRSSTAYSKRSSTTTVSNKSPDSSPHNSHVEIIPPIPSAPTFPPPALVSPNLFGAEPVANPFADNNPFEDTHAFAEVEYIKRPFNPSLPDELQVAPDDSVRVLQTFDDGWALVEKVATDDGKGKERHGNYEKGLIPIDCLREPGETLSSFFAVKRVSTYNYAESTRTVSSESPFAFSAF